MSDGTVLHGPWTGSGSPAPGPRSPHRRHTLIDVDYRCADGHGTQVRFGQPDFPGTWACGVCGETAEREPVDD